MNLLKPYLLMFLIGFALLVCACGQTGDLYLPEEEKAEAAEPKEPESNTESKKETSKN